MSTTEIDQNKAEEFAGRMLGVLNDGALVLMASIGHRTDGVVRRDGGAVALDQR